MTSILDSVLIDGDAEDAIVVDSSIGQYRRRDDQCAYIFGL